MSLPAHLTALRDEAMQTTCIAWAKNKGWKLAHGIDRAGPCPECGGRDRFAIHTAKNAFNCRKCALAGNGVIDLVMKTEHVEFTRACEIITGRAASDPVDPERAAQLAARAKADADKRMRDAERYRQVARQEGFAIWNKASRFKDFDEILLAYMAIRGIDLAKLLADHENTHPMPLRTLLAHDYVTKIDGQWEVIHTGPAMIGAVQRADGSFGAAHQTWLDLQRPKGKAVLGAVDGKELATKKMRGSKTGGAIRLFTPVQPRRIVMGEGIETTLTAMAHVFEPDTAYWAGVTQGNMAGKSLRDGNGKLVMGQPDMEDGECFIPPEWCRELVYLGEGDAGNLNEKKLTGGLRRAMRTHKGLSGLYVPPPAPGQDLNDPAMAMVQATQIGT